MNIDETSIRNIANRCLMLLQEEIERNQSIAIDDAIDEIRHKVGERLDIAYGDGDDIDEMAYGAVQRERNKRERLMLLAANHAQKLITQQAVLLEALKKYEPMTWAIINGKGDFAARDAIEHVDERAKKLLKVVEKACKVDDCAAEFDGDLTACPESLNELYHAVADWKGEIKYYGD